jgi:adenine-specific DNA-methyltransferase
MSEPEKMKLTSMNIAVEKCEKLQALFPEVFSEGKIDFDQLRRVLGEWVDPGKERFGLNWPGKAECMKIIQQPSIATLKPVREESVNFDETENLFIEGDNLEVLKLLQKSYFGKVKMIYIDPPYNTGKEFIYPDKYSETLETYLAYTSQIDDEGKKFSTNTETTGRFHSRWLNMMYPRLYLAKNLLHEGGAVFISIDETEHPNLRALCNEVFGEENFVADFVWAAGRKNDSKHVSVSHEYIVVYTRNLQHLKDNGILWRQRKEGLDDIYAAYKRLRRQQGDDNVAVQQGLKEWYAALPDGHPAKRHRHYSCVDDRGIYFAADISWPGGGGPKYQVLHPVTKKPVRIPSRGWMTPDLEKMRKWIKEDRVHFGEDENSVPCIKSYLKDREYEVPYSVFYQDGRAATKRLRALMGGDVFQNPKDETVIQKLVEAVTEKDDIVLDCFAGSATTAHAVLALNAKDEGNRKFIIAQLPELCDKNSEVFKAGYKTIADIGKERIRRVIQKIEKEREDELLLDDKTKLDLGFRAFKLDRSNFKVWDGDIADADEEALSRQLEMHVDHISAESMPEDILYELLLKAGFPLTTKVETIEMAGKPVFSIQDGALLICLEDEVTPELIDSLAEAQALQVICLDAAFKGNDQLKTNAVQTFKSRAASTESEIVFMTV